MPGHPRRYAFKGRGYSALILPLDAEPILVVSTPFYEQDLRIRDIRHNNDIFLEIGRAIEGLGLSRADIGIVGMDILAVSLYRDLCAELPNARFFTADDIVMNMRAVKSEYEISRLRKGAEIADEVAKLLREHVAPGMTEREVAAFIISNLIERGVTDAFATCQSGERSRRPFDPVASSDKIIEDGDMVHMEINGKYQKYMIDVCRSTVVGKIRYEQRKILEAAKDLLEISIAHTKAGVIAENLERIAGEAATRYGLAGNFTSAFGGPGTYLGHAIGLGVDEPPVLAAGDKTTLRPGMVLTIEPGIYNTEGGGCRIEDEVLVTDDGCEVLNIYDRKWWD
jgi:Xaa-Pro aminopeptidase